MAQSRAGPLRTPSWLVGPGLTVPPFFLAMLVAVYPRPVAPTVALPRLDREEADRQLRVVLEISETGLAEPEIGLLRLWRAHAGLRAAHSRTGRQVEAVAAAQRHLQRSCRELMDDRGVARAMAVGDVVAADLVEALLGLPGRGREAEARAEAQGGNFLRSARAVGLIGPRGELRAHALVAAALAKAGFRAECGVPADTGLVPIERAALDLVAIRFGSRLPARTRAAAAERFGAYDPTYPAARSAAALLLAGGEPSMALEGLEAAAARHPADRATRNHYLFAMERLGQER